MTTPEPRNRTGPGLSGHSSPHAEPGAPDQQGYQGHEGHQGKHGWMMILCCIPMLAIAGALLAAGVVDVGFLVFAVACTALMALMMRGMNHGGSAR